MTATDPKAAVGRTVRAARVMELGAPRARMSRVHYTLAEEYSAAVLSLGVDDLSTDQRLMLSQMGETYPTAAADLDIAANRPGMTRQQARSAMNDLVRLGLVHKERRSRMRGYDIHRVTYYAIGAHGVRLRDEMLGEVPASDGPMYSAV
jgi:hypothetical protein